MKRTSATIFIVAFSMVIVAACGGGSPTIPSGSESGTAPSSEAVSSESGSPLPPSESGGQPASSETTPSGSAGSAQAAQLKALGLTPAPASVPDGPLAPNESGQVMVLLYHVIDAANKVPRWTRTPDGLRHDLETLYDRGYRPINAVDLVDGKIDVAKGYTPVVLTFDDSTEGQFRILPDKTGSETTPNSMADAVSRIDPDSAVGILIAFHESHPDWPLRATFYVNAGSDPFGQRQYAALKFRILQALGFEIGNHTLTHENLKDLDAADTNKQVGENQAEVAKLLPGYTMRTLALPYGGIPKNPDEVKSGDYDGTSYSNAAFLLVGSNPALSPFLAKFDPFKLPRIQVADPALKLAVTYPYTWLAQFDNHPEKRFVSDGDPDSITVPEAVRGKLNPGSRKVVWTGESR